jgi:CheY-like chemotaxis protein
MAAASFGFDRTVVLASADASLRQRLHSSLSGLRWQVREARGGAEAIAQLEDHPTEALLLDHWLPDLEVGEFAEQIGAMYPGMELLRVDGDPIAGGTKSPRRHELLHALREALGGANREVSMPGAITPTQIESGAATTFVGAYFRDSQTGPMDRTGVNPIDSSRFESARTTHTRPAGVMLSVVIDDMVGENVAMLELARIIRLVAPRKPVRCIA